ncbi:hypothetical protein FB384_002503 [Prauserella sediminis]|uniref:DUF2231 domain-containing protein n=1 Tax=Prauserella sediminis TaxID=577680 RepID=A0A839XNW4_9PSEU|nr:DUF2231 domain-containing protein [Prauserella sediminis]MBB3663599.1 hypothetical protein [Prauserella sediminis]
MDDTGTLFGLPLHPLLVHAVVVLVPLAVLTLLLAQFWPAARRRLGLVTPLAAVLVAALVPVTIAAGQSLASAVGPLPSVLEHERYGRMLLPWSIGLVLVATAQWGWFRWATAALRRAQRTRATTIGSALLGLAVNAVAVGNMTVLILAGHSGSRSVWDSVMS